MLETDKTRICCVCACLPTGPCVDKHALVMPSLQGIVPSQLAQVAEFCCEWASGRVASAR